MPRRIALDTLGSVLADYDIYAHCVRCFRDAKLNSEQLAGRLGLSYPTVKLKVLCKACGNRGHIFLSTRWPPRS